MVRACTVLVLYGGTVFESVWEREFREPRGDWQKSEAFSGRHKLPVDPIIFLAYAAVKHIIRTIICRHHDAYRHDFFSPQVLGERA